MAVRLDGVDCQECSMDEVYMDVKEEPGVYKVGAYCTGCDHDYGVLTRVSRSDVTHIDEVYEIGSQSITDILDGG